MSDVTFIDGPNAKLAYDYIPGSGPCIVFLHGYKSDMEGSKAVHLAQWAASQGRAFLRLDCSGHGQSGGVFEEGCIGDWAEDALTVIEAVTEGPLVLVGSSMGGWISCVLTKKLSRIVGFVGIAAAPDFTEDGFWATFSDEQKAEVMTNGQTALPSDYGEPYIVTKKLIEDGRNQLVLRSPLPMEFPVRLLQGTEDEAVLRKTALALLDHIDSPDISLALVKGQDHRFSTPECLTLIENAILDIVK